MVAPAILSGNICVWKSIIISPAPLICFPSGSQNVSAGSQTVDHQLKVLYRCQHIRDQYFRIEPDLSQFDVSPLMDNVSTKNIKALEAVGEKMVEEHWDKIKAFTRKLYISQIGCQPDEFYRMK